MRGRPTLRIAPLLGLALLIVTLLPTALASPTDPVPSVRAAAPVHPAITVTATVTLSQFSSIDFVQPGLYGLNTRLDHNLAKPFDENNIGATPVRFWRYPGGDVGERYNYSTNREYNDNGTSVGVRTGITTFITACRAVGCQAILQLPTEIDSPSTAAFYVNYVENQLGFHPAYWEVGNEPALWDHFQIPWVNWQLTNNENATPAGFALVVQAYVASIHAVDPHAQIVALGGTGQGSAQDKPWIKQIMMVDGPNISAISVHSYVGGSGPGSPTLTQFYNAVRGQYGLQNLTKNDRSYISSGCPGCTGVQLFITEEAASNAGSYNNYLAGFPNVLFIGAQFTQALLYNLSNLDYFAYNDSFAGSWFQNQASPNPIFYFYEDDLTKLGGNILNTAVTSTIRDIYAIGTKNTTGAYELMLVNANQTDTVSVTLNGFPSSGVGENYTWVNGSTTQPQAQAWTHLGTTFTIDPQSIDVVTVIPAPIFSPAVPQGRSQDVFQYDSGNGWYDLYGGVNDTTHQVYNDTWEFLNNTWVNVSGANSVPGVYGATSCYDASDGYVVLFGGAKVWGGAAYNFTWKLQGKTWTNITSGAGFAPPGYIDAQMSWDGGLGACLWFGGRLSTGSHTWSFVHGEWTHLSVTNEPLTRTNASLAYDPAAGTLVMFGGRGYAGTEFDNGPWSLSNSLVWSQISTNNGPSPRDGMEVAYSAPNQTLIFFGGWNGHTELADTWSLSSSYVWKNITTTSRAVPNARTVAGMTANATTVLMFSGYSPHQTGFGVLKNIVSPLLWNWYGSFWSTIGPWTIFPPTLTLNNSRTTQYNVTIGVSTFFGTYTGIAVDYVANWSTPPGPPPTPGPNTPNPCGEASTNGTTFNSVPSTVTIRNLAPSTSYCFSAYLLNGGSYVSAWSNYISTTTAAQFPPPPTGLHASSINQTGFTTGWTNPGAAYSIVNVTFLWGTVCGHWTQVSVGSTATSHILTGLLPATTYCVAVAAWNSTGRGFTSLSLQVTTNSSGGGGGGGGGGGSGGGGGAIGSGTTVILNTGQKVAANTTTFLDRVYAFLIPTGIGLNVGAVVLGSAGLGSILRRPTRADGSYTVGLAMIMLAVAIGLFGTVGFT